MRKLWTLLLAVIIVCCLSGCSMIKNGYIYKLLSSSSNLTSLKVPPNCEKLWNIDIKQENYDKISSSFFATWIYDDVLLTLGICPNEYNSTNYSNWEKIVEKGTVYYIWHDEVAWDAEDGSHGTVYTQGLAFERAGLAYSLSGEASRKDVSLDIVSLDTAYRLVRSSGDVIPDFEKTIEVWFVGFKKGNITLDISVFPPPFDQLQYAEWTDYEDTTFKTNGTDEYFIFDRQFTSDAPNSAVIAYLSDIGLIEIRGGVPYRYRNDVPREELDFINIDFTKQIAIQIE